MRGENKTRRRGIYAPLRWEAKAKNTGTAVRNSRVVGVVDGRERLVWQAQSGERDTVVSDGSTGMGAAGGVAVLQVNGTTGGLEGLGGIIGRGGGPFALLGGAVRRHDPKVTRAGIYPSEEVSRPVHTFAADRKQYEVVGMDNRHEKPRPNGMDTRIVLCGGNDAKQYPGTHAL